MNAQASPSVTVIIPAYREQDNIAAAIDSCVAAVSGLTQNYEILVIDDGSPDQTGAFARLKAETNANVRVVTNAVNQGFGYSFVRGVKMASKDYITVFPGDNDMSDASLKDLIAARGSADIIITAMRKAQNRPLARRVLSRLFVHIMNAIFMLRLKYYNGPFICRRELLQSLTINSTGLNALAECLIRILKSGKSHKLIYFEHTGRKHEKSKAINLKSLSAVAASTVILIKDIYGPAPRPK